VSPQALHPTGNYAYVKFDALFKYLMNHSNLMQCLPPLPVVVTSLLPSTTEVRPPPSDPHALHTPLELHNLCVTRFEPSWVTCATHVSHIGSELFPFWTTSE
jgi:hypothetical protein